MAKVLLRRQHSMHILLCVLMFVHVNAQGENCEGADEDAVELWRSPDGVFLGRKNDWGNNEAKLLGEDVASKASDDLAKMEEVRSGISDEGIANESDKVAGRSFIASSYSNFYYYQPTCPELEYWLRPGAYYWRYMYEKGGYKYISYYYNYHPIRIVYCAWNFCKTNHGLFPAYNIRSICTREYRYVWVPMLCYTIVYKTDGSNTRKWEKNLIFRRLWLPTDCCCKNYNYYYYYYRYGAARCPAK